VNLATKKRKKLSMNLYFFHLSCKWLLLHVLRNQNFFHFDFSLYSHIFTKENWRKQDEFSDNIKYGDFYFR